MQTVQQFAADHRVVRKIASADRTDLEVMSGRFW